MTLSSSRASTASARRQPSSLAARAQISDEWVHPSSRSNREQRDTAAATRRAAWQTANAELAACIRAATRAVAEAMPHLDEAAILHPPHAWFDAALARQIMITLLVEEFEIPRRVVAAVSLMSREAVARGLKTVATRRLSEPFDDALRTIQQRARKHLPTERAA